MRILVSLRLSACEISPGVLLVIWGRDASDVITGTAEEFDVDEGSSSSPTQMSTGRVYAAMAAVTLNDGRRFP